MQEFWDSPAIASQPGLKAVDLFEAIHERRIEAVWIMATNPVVSLPDADKVKEALQRCGLVVVSDCVERTDTTALAHVLLPAALGARKRRHGHELRSPHLAAAARSCRCRARRSRIGGS